MGRALDILRESRESALASLAEQARGSDRARAENLPDTIARFNTDHPIMDVLAGATLLKRTASTNGGEYHGPCPLCGGEDRFAVWPDHPDGKGRAWCIRGCDQGGDALWWAVKLSGADPGKRGAMVRYLRERGYTDAAW